MSVRVYATWARTAAFRRKLDHAKRELESALRGNWFTCSSWGKDSCALVALVHSIAGPGFDVAHLRSPYELPGYDNVLAWFSSRCTIHTIDTSRKLGDYITWLQTHGLHYEREAQGELGKTRKRDELVEWARDNGYTMQLLGMRAQESKGRRICFRYRGLTYRAHGMDVCNPLGWWTTRDVWAYLVSHDIPWHPLYDCETHGETRETLRNGGWLSVHGCNDARVPWLRRHYPDQYRQLVAHFPRTGLLG